MIQIIRKDEYILNKNKIIKYINELYNNDKDEITNIDETIKHLDFIFSCDSNDAFLLLNIKNNELICMVNFLEYNNQDRSWSLFSIFTKKQYRNKGLAKEILLYGIKEIEKEKGTKIISGIKKENIKSQKLHLQNGFIYEGKSWDDYADGFPENHEGYILQINV